MYVGKWDKCYARASILRERGSIPELFLQTHPDHNEINAFSLMTYLQAEQWLEKIHGKVELT